MLKIEQASKLNTNQIHLYYSHTALFAVYWFILLKNEIQILPHSEIFINTTFRNVMKHCSCFKFFVTKNWVVLGRCWNSACLQLLHDRKKLLLFYLSFVMWSFAYLEQEYFQTLEKITKINVYIIQSSEQCSAESINQEAHTVTFYVFGTEFEIKAIPWKGGENLRNKTVFLPWL